MTDIPTPNELVSAQTTVVYYDDGKTEIGRFGEPEPHQRHPRPGARARPAGGARGRGPLVLREQRHLAHGHRPRVLEQPHGRLDPGRLDDHPAVREERLPDAGAHLHAQGQGVLHRGQARPARRQGQDPRGLPQHHLLRPRRLRHPDRVAGLLRQGRRASSPSRRARCSPRSSGRPAGYDPPTTRTRCRPVRLRARRHGRQGLARRVRAARSCQVPEVRPKKTKSARAAPTTT